MPNRERADETKDPGTESGEPGGGRGRRDEVGGSGVYPASGAEVPEGADVRTPAEWGQGRRGAAGFEDSGRSELNPPDTAPEDHEGSGDGSRGGR